MAVTFPGQASGEGSPGSRLRLSGVLITSTRAPLGSRCGAPGKRRSCFPAGADVRVFATMSDSEIQARAPALWKNSPLTSCSRRAACSVFEQCGPGQPSGSHGGSSDGASKGHSWYPAALSACRMSSDRGGARFREPGCFCGKMSGFRVR